MAKNNKMMEQMPEAGMEQPSGEAIGTDAGMPGPAGGGVDEAVLMSELPEELAAGPGAPSEGVLVITEADFPAIGSKSIGDRMTMEVSDIDEKGGKYTLKIVG